MSYSINATHDPNLRSWVKTANQPGADFPIQNLPFGVFRRQGSHKSKKPQRIGVAIGDQILDVNNCLKEEFFDGLPARVVGACRFPSLNALMELEPKHWSALRGRLSELLSADSKGKNRKRLAGSCLVPMAEAEMLMPVEIGDYTDFYASVYHAANVGSMFRPDNPLLPNYKHVPIGYHGRASSIVLSGTPIRRPAGQTKDDAAELPVFGPSRLLDYEMEVGFFVGPGNRLGEPISIESAGQHIFGLCLVNDWSARDLQKWEYQPLGPFLAKNFATTISPWVVTLEALEPFHSPAFKRPEGDPEPLEYLHSLADQERGGIDLTLEVYLSSPQMREQGMEAVRLSRGSFLDMYWTIAQILAHHASNGCNLRSGDLLASGTVSGTAKDSRGCLLELTWRGSEPFQLPTGEMRRFLQDGDEVTMRGFCDRLGFSRIGFGDCRGVVLPVL